MKDLVIEQIKQDRACFQVGEDAKSAVEYAIMYGSIKAAKAVFIRKD